MSSVERFAGAPKGHHPRDFVLNAKSVITFGVALPYHVANWEKLLIDSELVLPSSRRDVMQNIYYKQAGYAIVNNLLNSMALRLSNLLEEKGCLSVYFPATTGEQLSPDFIRERIPSMWGLFSQRHAAVMAGLGEFGLNNVVVTPDYGPRVRFNSVITETMLDANPPLERKICLGESCSVCLQNCPGAISLRPDYPKRDVWRLPPVRTDIQACLKLRDEHYCLGRCIAVCPVGLEKHKL